MIKVVCAIIENDGSFLACRRKAEKARGGKWEFPGGKMHAGESPEESIKRELFEELSVDVEVNGELGSVKHLYPDISIELIALKCTIPGGTIHLTDHDEARWITFSELKLLDFSDADCAVIEKILRLK